MEGEPSRPKLDLDRDRIREVVSEALRMAHEYVDSDFLVSDEAIVEQLERNLSCGMSSATFRLQMGCKRYPDMVMRVEPRRPEVMLLSRYKQATARVNRILRAMR
jgi:hypothetical protein